MIILLGFTLSKENIIWVDCQTPLGIGGKNDADLAD